MKQLLLCTLPQENPDLFKWLTGRLAAPESMQSNPAYAVRDDDRGRGEASSLPVSCHSFDRPEGASKLHYVCGDRMRSGCFWVLTLTCPVAPGCLQALRSHVAQQMTDHSDVAAQAAPGKEWVRGWDDGWRNSSKQGVEEQQQQPAVGHAAAPTAS